MSDKDLNKLKSNDDGRFISGLVDQARKNSARVMAWKDIRGEKVTVDMFIRTVRKGYGEIEIFSEESETKEYNQVIQNNEKINLYIPSLAILFQVKIKRIVSKGNIVVSYPKMVAQVERRQHLRLNLSDSEEFQVASFFYKSRSEKFIQENTKTQLFEKECHDVGAGGLSFIVSKAETKFFENDDLVSNVHLIIQGREITVDTKVVAKIQIEPDHRNKLHYSGTKICMQFASINPEDQKYIETFVFRHVKLDQAS
jgi:hypothetical protein